MPPAPSTSTLKLTIDRKKHSVIPAHHVTAPAPGVAWSSYLPHWNAAAEPSEKQVVRTGFQNPWPSWVKPDIWQSLAGLEWEGQEQHDTKGDGSSGNSQDPDFEVGIEEDVDWAPPTSSSSVKVSWLGHAGVLLQLPSLGANDGAKTQRPLRILFDPIFSQRCSPLAFAGPSRYFPAPAPVTDLANIDFVLISHNHYDHLDLATLTEIWRLNRDHLRFVVPLGNASWFLQSSGIEGLSEEAVIELDWWDSIRLTADSGKNQGQSLTITCTPAQHGSGRVGLDANTALWSSWYLDYESKKEAFRTFFAGDTGYQLHEPHVEPTGDDAAATIGKEGTTRKKYPTCPAFEEIASQLGAPHLSLLPISVGATLSFLKSYDPFPVGWSPFPSGLDEGLTAANHMPPRDAVRVFNLMQEVGGKSKKSRRGAVALAIHWGTFVSDIGEAQQSLRKLKRACEESQVTFKRNLGQDDATSDERSFVALNAGQSIEMRIEESS